MVAFSKSFISFITAAILATSYVEAAPFPEYTRHATHMTRYIGKRALKLESYHPKSSFNVFGEDGVTIKSRSVGPASLRDSAFDYLNTQGISSDKAAWGSGFTSGSTRVAYMKQAINGVPLANAVASIGFNDDKVVSYSTSFIDIKSAKIAPSTPTVSWRSVLPRVETILEGTYNGWNTTLEYLAQSDGSVSLVHVVQIQNEDTGAWYEAYIDAHSGELVSVTDFVSDASYVALPLTKQSFLDGQELLENPEDLGASPFGWHSIGFANSTSTSGNNVIVFKGDRVQRQTSAGPSFFSFYNDTFDPSLPANAVAAQTNAFFVANAVHDFAYRYGFTEEKFNFQLNNFGKGGKENDRVLLSVQDASGKNNANFATPPDGQNGVCRMFTWDVVSPERDGSLQNDILIHELAHGITTRLTGGGTARCLQTLESGGMGEGWGDAMADWMLQTSEKTVDMVMGGYVTNSLRRGIRTAPYSVDKNVNSLTYSALKVRNQVHEIGEVWANMLHNVYAALVDKHGFAADKLTNADAPEGNVVFMRLYMDALSLQPCNPTFVSARDAWILADTIRYNGAHKCTVFNAFASRGLGLQADGSFEDDFTPLVGC
ncbi:Extracellular metalloproteinase MEP [Psilocybe cubensis]|uniref:Extracellular metalloproteinase n=2 Tax=Psilocybe cubensis TaxID=181762 RepID=A0A8H7XKF1_PSICU|nr:Extracellular metalloproteinase MEP [Psilocybe cubensis]KAH9477315.1 Extracellular metalloproteinase MEP [Psilocybe cubensis]